MEVYADFLETTPNVMLLTISNAPLSGDGLRAIQNSARRLGYEESNLGHLWLKDGRADALDTLSLGADDLRTIIEGLDPDALILCDDQARTTFDQAYRCDLGANSFNYVLGRSVVCLADIDELLQSDAGKQKAWALFKKLPRH